jgi:hypothetical protein
VKRAACLLLLLGACSWASFDNLSGETWVSSEGPPKGTDTTEFGANLAAGGLRPAAGGLQALVVSRANPDVSRLAFDPNGIVSQSDGGDIETTLNFTTFDDLHPATAGEPGTSNVAFAITTRNGINSAGTDPNVNTKIVFYDSSMSPPLLVGQVEPPTDLKAAKIASGFVFADINNTGGTADGFQDVVMARDDQVMIISDWSQQNVAGSGFAVDACTHQEPTSFSIAVADFDASNPGPEILLATGPKAGSTGPSKIKIFSPQAVFAYGGSGPAQDCFSGFTVLHTIDKSTDNVVDLGKQMLVTDFGTAAAPLPAIVATAPAENKLYIFTGDDGANEIDVQPPAGAGDWGDALAIGDLDGDGIPEVAIGAPKSTSGGVQDAGAVFVYSWNGNGLDLRATLYDAQPQVEQHFGQSVAIVPFGTGTQNVLVAGANNEIFTYFHLAPLYEDVRAGHQ